MAALFPVVGPSSALIKPLLPGGSWLGLILSSAGRDCLVREYPLGIERRRAPLPVRQAKAEAGVMNCEDWLVAIR